MKRTAPISAIIAAIITLCCFTSNSFSQAGNALDFDGTNDYADGSGISTSLTNITLEAWVYHRTLPASIQRYVTVGDEVAVIRHNGTSQQGQLHFCIKTNGSLHGISVNNALQTGQWYHVAGTWDGTNMKLYLNGEEVGTSTPGGVLNAPDDSVMVSNDTEPMDGYIDEVRIWNDARTAEEIRSNMYKTLTGTESGLENYWMFNESSGPTAYDSAGTVNLTLQNMDDGDWVTSGAFTGPRNALEFDGVNDYVIIPNESAFDFTCAMTVEAWIKVDAFTTAWQAIVTKGDGAWRLHRYNETDHISFGTNGLSNVDLEGATNVNDGQWHHVAGVLNGSMKYLYVDGVEDASINVTGSIQTTNDPVNIAENSQATDRYFDGLIDEVRIWNTARSQSEISFNMNTVLEGNESGLVAYYRFDQEEEITLYDQTSNGNDGTLTNMANEDWVASTAFNTWIGCAGTDWATDANWSQGTAPDSDSVNVGIPNYTGGNQPMMDGNFTCNNLTIDTGSDLTINSGRILTVNGNAFCSGSQSGAGIIELTGALASHTIAGTFNNIELDESNGAEMEGNTTINGTLTLTNGVLSIGANTLFLNGAISTTSGSLTGGSSSNITFGGSGASTDLPAISLGKLTINRANGIGLAGDVTIDDTLKLTDGALSINANTLTLKGIISTTSGSLSGGSSSNIFFGGSGASASLPAISLNDLTINRANGIGLEGNVDISGTLTLTNGSINLNGDTLRYNSGGTLKYNGTSLQTTTENEFPEFILGPDNLEIDNPSGVNLAFSRIISGTLTLADGPFSIGANYLTLSGEIITISGSLAGGDTSNITISGIGASTNLPGVTLNNLYINRPNGIGLRGNVHIYGNLFLMEGSINLDGNTLSYGPGGTLIYNGTLLQTTTSAEFPSTDGPQSLTINNTVGVDLTFDRTINNILTLQNGAFSIGANTLTLNGSLDTFSGILAGGPASNITFGGSGASTCLHGISLNNLIINRASGIGLEGDVCLDGTLTLTDGPFTVGSNTLTIKNAIAGNPTSLVAANTSSFIIAGSGSGINIPSSVSDLKNLVLNNPNGTSLQANLMIDSTFTLTNGTLASNGHVLSYGPGSTLIYNGTSAQTTTSNEFPSVDGPRNLTIDNANGVNLAFNRTVDDTLTLTNGALSISYYTLTLKGAISATSGSLTGGPFANIFFGGSAPSTNLPPVHLKKLTINRGNGIKLDGNITIDDVVLLTNGDLDLNGHTLTLTILASLSESDGNTVKGDSGMITTVRTFDAGDLSSGIDIAGMGAEITTGAGLGLTSITREHTAQTENSVEGIFRYYDISPANNSGLNATLTFHYDESELNGKLESDLELYRSIDSGANWSIEGGTVDTDNETITLSGIDAFSRWTAFEFAFTWNTGISLRGVSYSDVAWGDYDNDGDLDILMTGVDTSNCYTKIYRNNGDETFTDINALLRGAIGGTADWGDYDSDGDLDILLSGGDTTGFFTIIYRNDGSDIFTGLSTDFIGVYYGDADWGDYDNDGDLDIVLTGYVSELLRISSIYRNNGDDTFTDIDAGLPGLYTGSASWGDYDNDGDLDILLTGINSSNGITSIVYRNDGSGAFTDINAGLTGVYCSSAAWGDYDNDGYPDILLSGSSESGITSIIYHNNGDGTFTDIEAGLAGVCNSSVAWGDYENDGDLDILLSGIMDPGSANSKITRVYRNNGDNTFSNIVAGLTGVDYGSTAWGDYDNDGDLDILMTGTGHNDTVNISRIYRNNATTANTAPSAPSDLQAMLSGAEVFFNWDAAGDAQSDTAALTYNLRLGTSSGGVNIISPMAFIGTNDGLRKIAAHGSQHHNTSWAIRNLPDDSTYYWSVQAIDPGFMGSVFAIEDTFELNIMPFVTSFYPPDDGHISLLADLKIFFNENIFARSNKYINIYNTNHTQFEQIPADDARVTILGNEVTIDPSADFILDSSYYIKIDTGAFRDNVGNDYAGISDNTSWNFIADNHNEFPFALDFDGIDDHIEIPDDNNLDLTANYTIETWIRPDSFLVSAGIVGKFQTSGSDGYYLRLHEDAPYSGLCFDDLYTATGILSEDQWYHLAAVSDNGTRKLYLNGIEQSLSGTPLLVLANNDKLCIGVDLQSRYFDGIIEEVRIWNIARTQEDIRQDMHLFLTGVESGLVSNWHFNEGCGTIAYDMTGRNNGTLINMDEDDWVISTGPVGVGNSNTQIVSVTDSIEFTGTDLAIKFTAKSGTDTVVVSRIDANPNIEPTNLTEVLNDQYWVVNKFGNGTFTANLTFTLSEDLSSEYESLPSAIKLYTRASNADTAWAYLADASIVNAANDEVTFDSITGFSQFIIGIAPFTDIDAGLPGVDWGCVSWGDYDNDDDLDILISGHYNDGADHSVTRIYRNNGNNSFSDIGAGLTEVSYSSLDWGDYDSDGDLDILLVGYSDIESRISRIYRNNGDETFTDIGAVFDTVMMGSVAWGDYDNDGDPDILLTGYYNDPVGGIAIVYRNNGDDTFTDICAGLAGVCYGSVAWGDYDKDGDLDILLTGSNDVTGHAAAIYRNNGDDTFTDIDAGLSGVMYSSAAWGDYDSDGDLDILLTGYNDITGITTTIYRNNGDNTFTDINAGLAPVYASSVAWGDYDSDGDLDILLVGCSNIGRISYIYRNNGDDTFTDIDAGLSGVIFGSAAWGDYDNDGRLDILVTGEDNSGQIARIYRNNASATNSVPNIPSNLLSSVSGQDVMFSWDKPTDNETTQAALTFNLRLGTSSGGVASCLSHGECGQRLS